MRGDAERGGKMTVPPSRAEILAALQDPQRNDIASRVAEAITAYTRAFEDAANRRGSLENIRLPAPTDEVEAVALEMFLGEMRARMPNVPIKIKGDS
jgi:hypothetical protein